jgi:signal transduction histidine kinase
VVREFLPLRLKLTLWSVGVFLVIQAAVAGVWILGRRPFATLDVDADLTAKIEMVAHRLAEPDAAVGSRNELDRLVQELSRSGPELRPFGIQVWTSEGGLYSRSGAHEALAEAPFQKPDYPEDVAIGSQSVALVGESTAPLRVATRGFRDAKGELRYLQITTPVPLESDGMGALHDFVLFSLPVGLLAAGIAAWIMAGRVVSPIQRLAKAARAVSPTSLEDRIDVGPADSEIARLQHELNRALERLERGYREQGAFISNVSHELKTPIAVLLSQAQVLKQEDRTSLEYRRFLAVVEEEMRVVGGLVESFLVLARIGHGKELVRRERLNVNDVVLESAAHCAALSRHHEVPLVTMLHLAADGEADLEIEGDPELLRTMLENLVRNALRFSPSGEPVDLRVTCTKDRASIRVRDRGPGIPREHMERVFDRFYQIAEVQSGPRGSGLGLAIAKSVAELHHGTISVHNCADRGCEFEVLLPLVKSAHPAEIAPSDEELAAGRSNVAPEPPRAASEPAAKPNAQPPRKPLRKGLPATE